MTQTSQVGPAARNSAISGLRKSVSLFWSNWNIGTSTNPVQKLGSTVACSAQEQASCATTSACRDEVKVTGLPLQYTSMQTQMHMHTHMHMQCCTGSALGVYHIYAPSLCSQMHLNHTSASRLTQTTAPALSEPRSLITPHSPLTHPSLRPLTTHTTTPPPLTQPTAPTPPLSVLTLQACTTSVPPPCALNALDHTSPLTQPTALTLSEPCPLITPHSVCQHCRPAPHPGPPSGPGGAWCASTAVLWQCGLAGRGLHEAKCR